jgi:hypothetical protein
MTFTIHILFTIVNIMFFIVGDQVGHRKAIVGGDEVDACCGSAVVAFVKIGASGESERKLSQHAVCTPPEVAHAVAVFSIPLSPAGREFSYLISAFANVPRFSYQFHLRDNRVLVNDIKESTETVHFMQFACKGGGKIKPETIYMHVQNPITEAVHHQP